MAHTFSNHLYHIVFSTAERRRFLAERLHPRLFEYVGGIVRKENASLLRINGTRDHVHMLVRIPPATAVSDFVLLQMAAPGERPGIRLAIGLRVFHGQRIQVARRGGLH